MVTLVRKRSSLRAAGPDVDPAVRQARRVVGLYGDPDVTWSIVLQLDLAEALSSEEISARVPAVFGAHPHLGLHPAIERRDATTLDRFANEPYADDAPLVRLALDDAGRQFLVAAHHGAVDGLGLVGLAGRLLGLELGTSARGVQRTGEEPGFLAGSLRRIQEIVLRPPERFRGSQRAERGDHLVGTVLPFRRQGTGALAWAGLSALRLWNGSPPSRSQAVIALGVSRRSGLPAPPPDRNTAYTRLRVSGIESRAALTELLIRTEPEPDFPVTDAHGLGAVVTRLLASRLGASMLVSNLGEISGRGVTSARFWPVASGPNGVSLGLVSAGDTTTMTVRARRGWFSEDDADALLDVTVKSLPAQ
jgi:hypothetical protein